MTFVSDNQGYLWTYVWWMYIGVLDHSVQSTQSGQVTSKSTHPDKNSLKATKTFKKILFTTKSLDIIISYSV